MEIVGSDEQMACVGFAITSILLDDRCFTGDEKNRTIRMYMHLIGTAAKS